MKNVKHKFCVLLAALMVLSMLAACAPGNSAPPSGVPSPTATAGSAPDESPAAGDEKDYSERIKVSWAQVIEGDEGTDYTQDKVYQHVLEKFNIEIEIIPLTWGNWLENLRIWINSGDMPDVVNWNYVHAEFMDYVDQGLVRKFNDDWKQKWPNAARLYEMSGLGSELDSLVGGAYAFPVPIYFNHKPAEVLTAHFQTYMRKDWVQAVGVEVKSHYTMEEFLDLARKLKEQDPGNVGRNFFPITSWPNMISPGMIYSMYQHTDPNAVFYKADDGQYKWGPADEQTYEALKNLQDAYKEGLVHPEFFTLNQGEDEDMMTIAGTSAIFWAGGLANNYNLFADEMRDNTDLNPDDALMSAFIVDNNGKYRGVESANYFGALLMSPDMDDKTFERVMDLVDFSTTEEGQLLFNMGFEGEDYNIEADGSITALKDEAPTRVYPSIKFFQTLATRGDDFSLIAPTTPLPYREKQKEQYIEKYSLTDESTMALRDWNVAFHSSPARSKAELTYPDEYSQLILKDGDLRTNWESWVAEKLQLIQPVLDELNSK